MRLVRTPKGPHIFIYNARLTQLEVDCTFHQLLLLIFIVNFYKMDGDEKILKALEVVFTKLGMSIPVIFKLRGFVLDNRFKISKSMTEGAFGKIFTGSDVLYSANEV